MPQIEFQPADTAEQLVSVSDCVALVHLASAAVGGGWGGGSGGGDGGDGLDGGLGLGGGAT